MKASRYLWRPLLLFGLLCLLNMPSASHAAKGCPHSDGPQILRTKGDGDRQIWLFGDPDGLGEATMGKIGDFKHCQKVLDVDEAYQTIQLEHKPSDKKVWIMRAGIGLTTDAHVTCLAEDNESGTMGVRGMGEDCAQ